MMLPVLGGIGLGKAAAWAGSTLGLGLAYSLWDNSVLEGFDLLKGEDPSQADAIRQQALLMEGRVGQAQYQGFMDKSERRDEQVTGMIALQDMQERQRDQMYMGALAQEFDNLFQQNDDIITDMMAPLLR
jgi:hypothetical protein